MSPQQEPIAIIGSGCRFPGDANTPSQLWELLRDPRVVAQKLDGRFNADGFYHPNGSVAGHSNVTEAYFLTGSQDDREHHQRFDAGFFGINAQEASVMDPQARLLLETVYEALESAGQTMENLRGSDTAMYAGQMTDDYSQMMGRDLDTLGTYHAAGTSRALLANRVSYFFDWHGPSLTVDTACSSSLIAVHLAVQQLRSGQSRTAVVAGANLILDPHGFVAMSSMQMLSPDGRSRMWDADANGYARAEGIAAVVLKTLSAAEADGDHIECIIRETALNQDGRTTGITMPSATAQAQLIRDCYARAGLDPTANPADRPQYFECHGTGTQVGDANESEAINLAFFPDGDVPGVDHLMVGGIKSVLGHSESTAGLAGLLKTSLSLQNAIIPPNLLLERLNPRIRPFHRNLEVLHSAASWPNVPVGSCRRASVNSFGFGGSNAHCILESYTPVAGIHSRSNDDHVFTPFVFSATSTKSLSRSLAAMRDHIRANQASLCLRDLSYTLFARRSSLQVALSIAASSCDDLCEKLDGSIRNLGTPGSQIKTNRHARPTKAKAHSVLGVFTGQGAQWAAMGAELITQSKFARELLSRLDKPLQALPHADRPTWSLADELQKPSMHSRINEAAFSQPLCTAIQILQVELLRAAGITFSAVVGHSSGEIAAAFAAGFITADDAICIAYYRGLYSALAHGTDGKVGAMIAVGTSADDASELCDDPELQGRVSVAAVNAPGSVTMSGDQDAVDELKLIFDDEKKFARILKVDKAYHSHHMRPCLVPYLEALAALKIQVASPAGRCAWFSSVHEGIEMSSPSAADFVQTLGGQYWAENMEKPVLFMQSVLQAVSSHGPFDLSIELGPHPALKAPVMQTLAVSTEPQNLPYTSMFTRGISATESVAECLGYIWTHAGNTDGFVDLLAYDRLVSGQKSPQIIKGLPPYTWDHDTTYWHESRVTRATRQRTMVHELLGHQTPNSTVHDMWWRNFLSPKALPWLLGHRLQGQVVFPAAGFVAMAIEAALIISPYRVPSLIEVADFDIGKALVFDSDESYVEVIVSMSDIVRDNSDHSTVIQANFKCSAAAGDTLDLVASGRVCISLEQPADDLLPPRPKRPTNLLKLHDGEFYNAVAELDYQYSGPFAALTGLERKLGAAVGHISVVDPSTTLLLHPAVLDSAFQAVLLAFSAPEDGGLFSLHVPRTIGLIRINPQLCARQLTVNVKESDHPPLLSFHATHPLDVSVGCGDVDVFPFPNATSEDHAHIQVQRLELVPLSRPTERDDKEMFSTIVWDTEHPDCQLAADVVDAEIAKADIDPSATQAEQQRVGSVLERMAGFYLRVLERETPIDDISRTKEPTKHLFHFARHIISRQRAGEAVGWQSEWEADTHEEVAGLWCQRENARVTDVQLLEVVGRNLVEIVRGHTSALEVINNSNDNQSGGSDPLTEYYAHGACLPLFRRYLSRLVGQMVHSHPHMHMLEVGAGTGSATKAMLDTMGTSFASYTFTDISPAFLEMAAHWTSTSAAAPKIVRKALDIEKDPVEQGFVAGSFDAVFAISVLHATATLEQTLRNARRLLKPGGRLVAFELLPTEMAFYGVVFGAMSGWWSGAQEGRVLNPAQNLAEWDRLLRLTGFSGIDSSVAKPDDPLMPSMLFTSQAVDDRVTFLRDPLAAAVTPGMFGANKAIFESLVILDHDQSTGLAAEAFDLIKPFCGGVTIVPSLDTLPEAHISSSSTILSLIDLAEPALQHLTPAKWEALKTLIFTSMTLALVTTGRRAANPHANMMLGLLRSTAQEVPGFSYHSLDFEDHGTITARRIVTELVRFKAATLWRGADTSAQALAVVENELVLDLQGRAFVPRARIGPSMNGRYNSARRLIEAPALPSAQSVRIAPSELGFELQLEAHSTNYRQRGALKVRPKFRVAYSVLHSIRASESGFLFLWVGQDLANPDKQVMALSPTHASLVDTWENVAVPLPSQIGSEPSLLLLVSRHLVAWTVVKGLVRGDAVWVHHPDPTFAAVLEKEARIIGLRLIFSTATTAGRNTGQRHDEIPRWISISPTAPERTVINCVRQERPSVFVDMTDASNDKSGANIWRCIQSQVRTSCRKYDAASLFGKEAYPPPVCQGDDIRRLLDRAVAQSLWILSKPAAHGSGNLILQANVLGLDEVTQLPFAVSGPDCTVNWTGCSEVQVKLQPIDSIIRFVPDGTYWLAGLSGSLGLSLCEWMVRHGAKHIVISSRAPQVDPVWLEEMEALGAVVAVHACDVVQRAEVIDLHARLTSTWPPIVGVVQGAMVLDDTSTQKMSLETLLKVTQPKVEGSVHLSNLFPADTLDFFVFLSSAVAIIGRPGQSNYAAANMFMVSLAEQRRRRGLAASVMHIGPVRGVGSITQMDVSIFSRTRRQAAAFVFVSERDFHQMFAEAVVAGQAGPHAAEIFSGVRHVGHDEPVQPAWVSQSLMSHFIGAADDADAQMPTASSKSGISVKAQLANANSRDEVSGIVQRALALQLCAMFHMDPSTLDDGAETLRDSRLDQLGMDSLLAMELRSWFVKTLQVNIPVLKILSGVSIGELVTTATESIPVELVPMLQPGLDSHPSAVSAEPMPDQSLRALSEKLTISTDLRTDPELVVQGRSGSPDGCANEDALSAMSDNEQEFSFDEVNTDVVESTTATDSPVTSEHKITMAQEGSIREFPAVPALKSTKLSYSQRIYWFANKFLDDKTTFNHSGWAHWSGSVRINDLANALHAVGQRHEAVRTCFNQDENDWPSQSIMENSNIHLERRQISCKEDVVLEAERLRNEHVFDLERGETMKVILLTLSPDDHFVLLGLHPIVLDAISLQIFVDDLMRCYTDPYVYSQGYGSASAIPQFSDFSDKQHDEYHAGLFQEGLEYWRGELMPLPPLLPVLSVAQVASRPPLTSYENVVASVRIGADTGECVKAVCMAHRVTPFHFYVAAFRALLLRFTPVGEEEEAHDLAVGIHDANRAEHEMMQCIGPFANYLPVRLQTSPSAQFQDLLKEVRSKAYAALENGRVPFQLLVDELEIARSETTTPLFQSFVNYRRQDVRLADSYGDVKIQPLVAEVSRMAYDVTLDLVDEPNSDARCTLLLRKDLYDENAAGHLAAGFERLVRAFSQDPSLPLTQPDIFDPSEIVQVQNFSQGSSFAPAWPSTVLHKVDEMAKLRPGQTAVSCEDNKWTYEELMQHASNIATALQSAGIRRGASVAVLVEPSTFWVAAVLGIMRIGAIYLPLEPGTPAAYIAGIIDDCKPDALLVDTCTRYYVEILGTPETVPIIDLSRLSRSPINEYYAMPVDASGTDTAAIMYTSGSTGSPKGIIITHQNLTNLIEPLGEVYNIGTDEVVLQQTAPTFDVSLLQVFTALTLGGSLCIVPRQQRGNGHAVAELVAKRGVTITTATPTEYNAWLMDGKLALAQCSKWRRALSIGEPVLALLVSQFAALCLPDLVVWNLYGPTETTIMATSFRAPLPTRLPSAAEGSGPFNAGLSSAAAGHPHPNYTVHVLDAQLRPVPAGIQGQVYIGGAGVTRGYLNNASLTASYFVPDPFIDHANHPYRDGATLHRTGDKGRWRAADGALLIEGRIVGGTMVKLRGVRLDVAEIEHVLATVGGDAIRQVAVSLRRDDAGAEYLAAHVVLQDRGASVGWTREMEHVLRRHLAARLPRHMCPAVITPTPNLPRKTSGKVDRSAVAQLPVHSPAGSLGVSDKSRVEGADDEDDHTRSLQQTNQQMETETRLRGIWASILPDSQLRGRSITPHTDFFHVGGSSLLLLRLKRAIRTTWALDMPLVTMFDVSTLADMACWIDSRRSSTTPDPSPASKPREHLPPGGIDWEKETSIPPGVLTNALALADDQPLRHADADRNKAGKTVVLTGATGLVGGALLRALASHPAVARVHCIAVRRVERLQASIAASPWHHKVTLHAGDLLLPRLGLAERDATHIFGGAHAAVHCAADMSSLKTYASLRGPNVQATKEVAAMCAGRTPPVPLHYVSSIASGRFAAERVYSSGLRRDGGSQDGAGAGFVLHPVSLANSPPSAVWAGNGVGVGGRSSAEPLVGYSYAASKWASEVFLERLSMCHPDWRIAIHRASFVVPDNWNDAAVVDADTVQPNNGGGEVDTIAATRGQASSFDSLEVLDNLQHYIGLLGGVVPRIPDRHIIRGGWDLVPLRTVVEGLMAAILDEDLPCSSESASVPPSQIDAANHADMRLSVPDQNETTTARSGSRNLRIAHHISSVHIPTAALHERLMTATTKTLFSPNQGHGGGSVADLQIGAKTQELELVQWARAAGELGMHPTVVAMLETIAAPGGGLTFPRVAK